MKIPWKCHNQEAVFPRHRKKRWGTTMTKINEKKWKPPTHERRHVTAEPALELSVEKINKLKKKKKHKEGGAAGLNQYLWRKTLPSTAPEEWLLKHCSDGLLESYFVLLKKIFRVFTTSIFTDCDSHLYFPFWQANKLLLWRPTVVITLPVGHCGLNFFGLRGTSHTYWGL